MFTINDIYSLGHKYAEPADRQQKIQQQTMKDIAPTIMFQGYFKHKTKKKKQQKGAINEQ